VKFLQLLWTWSYQFSLILLVLQVPFSIMFGSDKLVVSVRILRKFPRTIFGSDFIYLLVICVIQQPKLLAILCMLFLDWLQTENMDACMLVLAEPRNWILLFPTSELELNWWLHVCQIVSMDEFWTVRVWAILSAWFLLSFLISILQLCLSYLFFIYFVLRNNKMVYKDPPILV